LFIIIFLNKIGSFKQSKRLFQTRLFIGVKRQHEQQECITDATLDAAAARVARSHFAAIYHSVFHVRLSV